MKHAITVQGSEEQFFCAESQHLLQGMQTVRLGTPMLEAIPVGCRGGGCGVCRIRIVAGQYETSKMSRKHVPEQDLKLGIVLACRVFPRSELCVEVLSLPDSQ